MIIPQEFAIVYSLIASIYAQNPDNFTQLTKPGSILVIGSRRAEKSPETHFTKSIWGEGKLDFSYKNRPDIITLDIEPSFNNTGTHIVGDAATINLEKKINIRELYLERPWTFDPHDVSKKNIVTEYIKNLLPRLRPGGMLTIEWHPFISLPCYHNPAQKQVSSQTQAEQLDRIKNPFTGFFDHNIARVATFFAIKKQFPENTYPSFFIEEARKLSPHVDALLNFYTTQQSATRADLNKRLLLEVEIIDQILKSEEKIAFMPKSPHASIISFNNEVDHILLPSKATSSKVKINIIPLFVEQLKKHPNIAGCTQYTYNSFLSRSLFYFLWSDMSVITNGPLAIKCLKDLGLKGVTLKRGESHNNNRKNVHLLSGYKF